MYKTFIYLLAVLITITTVCYAEIPETPSISSVSATSTSITIRWSKNTDDITDGYYIEYYETNDSTIQFLIKLPNESFDSIDTLTTLSHTFSGLSSGTKYTVNLYAYDGSDESGTDSTTITTDDLSVSAELTAEGQITVSVQASGTNITQYEVWIKDDGSTDDYVLVEEGIDSDDSYSFTRPDGDYLILVIANDSSGVELSRKSDIPVSVDDFETFLSQNTSIENGCFVSSVTTHNFSSMSVFIIISLVIFCFKRLIISRQFLFSTILILIIAQPSYSDDSKTYNNFIGLKGSYFEPSENNQSDVYDNIYITSIFFERTLYKFLSADFQAGYSKTEGKAIIPSSGLQTGVETDLELIPLSVSLNANYEITPLISFFIGAGGDWWNYKEKSPVGEYDGHVGGWHAKSGFKLLTEDYMLFRKAGLILEANYSQIDRFGDNDVDLGGWAYSLGLFYCF